MESVNAGRLNLLPLKPAYLRIIFWKKTSTLIRLKKIATNAGCCIKASWKKRTFCYDLVNGWNYPKTSELRLRTKQYSTFLLKKANKLCSNLAIPNSGIQQYTLGVAGYMALGELSRQPKRS